MNDQENFDAWRSLFAQMRGDDGSDLRAYLIDANRLIKAFVHIEDSKSRQQVIDLAEAFAKRDIDPPPGSCTHRYWPSRVELDFQSRVNAK
jgi:hypothetical protein